VSEDHLLGFDTADGCELLEDRQALAFAADHFEDDDAVWRGEFLPDIVQPKPRLDVRAIVGENLLDDSRMLYPIRDVNADDDVTVLLHGVLLCAQSSMTVRRGKPEDRRLPGAAALC